MTPGQAEQAEAELRRADRSLEAARILLRAGTVEDAASRLYYAAFHAARAALTIRGRYSKTHSGLVTLFGQAFGPADILSRLLAVRIEADYDFRDFGPSQAALESEAEEVSRFLERCRAIVAAAIREGPNEPDPPPDR